MTTQTTLTRDDLARALVLAKKIRQQQADALAAWEADAADMARQGYAPHYCVHGTNLWTDYDNICGGCEEFGHGFPNPYLLALGEIRWEKALIQQRVKAAGEALSVLCSVQKHYGQQALPQDIVTRLMTWCQTGE